MEGSVEDLGAPPDSWEVADLEANVSRLMLSSEKESYSSTNPLSSSSAAQELADGSSSSSSTTIGAQKVGAVSEDDVNSVDQFLCEALQNPRERLSVLRIEQDIVKFIRDATKQQMEFQQLPTSYLRLAAHRVAQHYSLQSMVLLDNSLPDGSGSRIVIRKTSESRIPSIRLADIPVNLPIEDSGGIKVAIKQRPQKGSPTFDSANSHSTKTNNSRSVEERKEEYNRARARIFNSGSFGGVAGGRTEIEPRLPDSFQNNSLGLSKAENNYIPVGFDVNNVRGSSDSSTNTSRLARSRIEQEQFSRSRSSNRVAIFRDREVERKDPDYDRSYDRYMQRFDPGFRFNGPYTVQPMYSPAVNYNTEFPQLGSAHMSSISTEQQPLPHPQHLPGSFTAPSTPAGIGYGHPDAMMSPFSPNHVGARSTPALYFHSVQYPCQHPGMPFIHPHEQVHHPFSQSHQQQLDASFGLARPR